MPDWRPDLQRKLEHLPLPAPRRLEIADELTQHLDEHHRDLLAQGVELPEAERLTRLELDRAALLASRLPAAASRHPQRRLSLARAIAGVGQDARFAARLFRRRAGVMSLAFGGLAAAIALGAVIFSALNAIALRPMAVPSPEQVVSIHRWGRDIDDWTMGSYERLRQAATRLRPEAWWLRPSPPSPDFEAAWHDSVPIHFVGETFLETFGGTVAEGRLLAAEDHLPAAPVRAVVNHTFWTRRLRADPALVGRTLTIGETPVTIVGIAARSFGGPSSHWDSPAAMWMPLAKRDAFDSKPSTLAPHARPVAVIARIHDGVSLEAAQAEVSSIAAADSAGTARTGLRRLDPPFDADDLLGIGLTLALIVLLLLQAYANVANLLLAGASVRQPEIAARLALGASRWRVTRQLITETLILGAGAGLAGVLLAAWIGPTLTHVAWIPPSVDLSPDWRVILFVVAISAGAALVCGLAVARHAIGADVSAALKSAAPIGGRRRSARLRHVFVGVQAATSILLLVGASLFTRALVRTAGGDFGMDVDRVLSVSTTLTAKDVSREGSLRAAALERVRAMPEVEVAAVAANMPLVTGHSSRSGFIQNDVSPEYFAALGVRLLRGRLLTAGDVRARAPVAVVSAALARRYWPGEDALGATLQRVHESLSHLSIVGIAGDTITAFRQSSPPPIVYVPATDAGRADWMVVRARADAAGLVAPLESALRALDPALNVYVRTVRAEIDRAVAPVRMIATVAGILAAFTLVLAALGLAGVTTFTVQQRQREIGVRLALGASRDRILTLLIRQSLLPVAIGLVVGLLAALVASGVIRNALYGIGPRDPLAIATATGVLVAAALVAVIVPSGRATRLDPAKVLRE